MWGETTRVENRGETTRGETTRRGNVLGAKRLVTTKRGDTTCYKFGAVRSFVLRSTSSEAC